MVTSKQPATLLSKAHGAKGKHEDPALRTWSAADVLGPSYAAACAWQPRWVQGKIQNKSQEWTFVIVLEEGEGRAVSQTGWNAKDGVFHVVLKTIVLGSHWKQELKL